MAVFPLLADAAGYRACDNDLLIDHAARRYWLDLFASHFDVQLRAARSIGASRSQCDAAASAWLGEIERIRARPDVHGRLDILLLDELRQAILTTHGINDEFRLIKARENAAAMRALPRWLEAIDASPEEARLDRIAQGMLAGNLFDMGVKATAEQFGGGEVPLQAALDRLPPRPWLFDDVVPAAHRLRDRPPAKAVIFADNAGGDAILGVLPLARELLRRGVEVVVGANQTPTLNDITAAELQAVVAEAGAIDSACRSTRLRVVSTGSQAPLIDLSHVSEAFAAASADADLVVLVGMGRGIESNWSARFICSAWRVAMIKDPQVAKTVGGGMFDAVFRCQEPSP